MENGAGRGAVVANTEKIMPLSHEEIAHRVTYHKPSPETVEKHQDVRHHVSTLMANFQLLLPDSREASLCMTKLEEALFWANAAIARNAADGVR